MTVEQPPGISFDDPAFTDAFTAAVNAHVQEALKQIAPRWAKVESIDVDAGTCEVLLAGSGTTTVVMHMIRPALVGQEVLIEGPSGARIIRDVKGGGYVVGGLRPGDLDFTMRTPDGITEVYAAGQTIEDAETLYPIAWVNMPASAKSGSDLIVPDMKGRGAIGRDDMGGTAANRITSAVCGLSGTTLGAAGGDQRMHQHTHTQDAHTHVQNAHTHAQNPHAHTTGQGIFGSGFVALAAGAQGVASVTSTETATNQNATATNQNATATNQNAGAGTAQNVPPSLVGNWLLHLGVPATA